MTTLSATVFRDNLARTMNKVAYCKERIVVSRNKDSVALVPMEDLELLQRLDDAIDLADFVRIVADKTDEVLDYRAERARLGLK